MEYKIIQEFLFDLTFSNDKMPDILFSLGGLNTKASIALDVEVKGLEGTPIKMVTINLNAGVVIDPKNNLFSINTKYCALVEVLKEYDSEILRNLLTQEVPEKIYPNLCRMIEMMTSHSGFTPLILPEYSFKERKVLILQYDQGNLISEDTFKITESKATDNSFLTLKFLFDRIQQETAGAEFIKTLNYYVKGNNTTYESFLLYRWIFKHLKYNEYALAPSVPNDEYSKKLLFGLLILNDKVEWRFIKNSNNLPNIQVHYKDEEFILSDLQLNEIQELGENLLGDILTDLYISLYYLEYCHGGSIEFPEICVNKEMYFRSIPQDINEEEREFVEFLYSRIQKTYLEDVLLTL